MAIQPPPFSMRALLLLALLSGCAYTRPIDLENASSRMDLSERAARQTATVTVRGELPAPASSLAVGADSTSWIATDGALRVVPTSDLEVVRFPTSERNAMGTFLVGLLGSAAAGGVVGVVSFEMDGPSILTSSHAESATLFGVLFGALGGAVGGAIALDGLSPDRYVPADSTGVSR